MFLSTIACTARSDYEAHQHLHHFFREQERIFLWRWAGPVSVTVLSIRPPVETVRAARIDPARVPSGRPLSFDLRVVAAKCKRREGKLGAKVPIRSHGERRAWLAAKLAEAGSELRFAHFEDAEILAKDGLRIIGAETTGVLIVHDRARFLARLQQGFGRNRAFGCGLLWLPEVFA